MAIRYGRGKFKAHQNYVKYMEDIARNPAYANMPNAFGKGGRINWQVSSGKTTSFYQFYRERFDWWVTKADNLGLPGEANENDRFSLAARLIHPTKLRPCRLCGKFLDVGYMYLNKTLAKKWNKIVGKDVFGQKQDVRIAAKLLLKEVGTRHFREEIAATFRERCAVLDAGLLTSENAIEKFFTDSRHIPSPYLSPGFMSNPPDRLDGFHDYGLCCRKENDPGRSDENLKTYLHDRRAFQWWAEGDWKVADTLYYSAGPGKCARCGKSLEIVSPHHAGPLSCGFKQLPYFIPLCGPCNSSANRRMSVEDVQRLLEYENKRGESAASWQIRTFWDETKGTVSSKDEAKEISNILRSIEDYYLKVIYVLWKAGNAHFVSTFLSPAYAYFEILFKDLDKSNFHYDSYKKIFKKSTGTKSLAARSVRIAFEELEEYCTKPEQKRKLHRFDVKRWEKSLSEILELAQKVKLEPWASKWMDAVKSSYNFDKREQLISALLEDNYERSIKPYLGSRDRLVKHFNRVGISLAEAYKGINTNANQNASVLDSFFQN